MDEAAKQAEERADEFREAMASADSEMGRAIAAEMANAAEEEDEAVGAGASEEAARDILGVELTIADTAIAWPTALIASFSFWDLLIFPLSLLGAYKVGSGF